MSKVKVLLVDDEPDILEFLSYNFRKHGFDVYTAKNGLEGIQYAEAKLPNIIITDILMPDMDGIEMSEALRKKSELDKTPIVFLTAVQDDYKFIHAMTLGGDQYVSKPIRFEYLLTMVNQLITD